MGFSRRRALKSGSAANNIPLRPFKILTGTPRPVKDKNVAIFYHRAHGLQNGLIMT
jgi:hypothetical protein